MDSTEEQRHQFKMVEDNGEIIVEGEIIGRSVIPYYDDLKCKAIIALLNSIDQDNFVKAEKWELFEEYFKEIEETLTEIKKFNKFQGNVIQ
ncbi:hypothetical protein J2S74_002037 [Evansella vedderi]|uniref:Uncharacterized protein n=1 Tax=Evansella vedderi TaxID=38282 RepID=A0ABT9ZTS8_9BACI|nr:hypothetical protein [Evansella vedderi]MDQ0254658.1 hypothetical protein [Evansella vedderi]